MRHKTFIYFIITISILGLQFVSAKNSVGTLSADPDVLIVISDAYYADLQGDGFEDDVYVSVELIFSGSSTYNFDYYIVLSLPSGVSYVYVSSFSSKINEIHFDNYFWNHATESGWYNVEVHIVMRTGGITITSESLIFDPPGGTGGADPIGFTLLY